jgi:hypothetical protein
MSTHYFHNVDDTYQFDLKVEEKALSSCSTFWPFSSKSDDLNLDKITIFCYLNCISECINGFSVVIL